VSDEYRIRKHRGKLSLVHNDPDRGRVRIALGTDDRGLAEARARELWRAKHRPPSERVADLWAAYVKDRLPTGARMSALLDMKWSQVDFEHGTIDLNPAGREKTNKRRAVVPINSRARVALEEAKQGAETDHVIEYAGAPIKSIRKAIRQAAARSGIPCSPHVFRHTAGVMMAQADVPMQKIAQYLGHTSTRVTERVYARYSPSFMRDASAALDW
jgi:integrase